MWQSQDKGSWSWLVMGMDPMGISSPEGGGGAILGVWTLIWLCYHKKPKENQNSILDTVVKFAWLREALLRHIAAFKEAHLNLTRRNRTEFKKPANLLPTWRVDATSSDLEISTKVYQCISCFLHIESKKQKNILYKFTCSCFWSFVTHTKKN